MERLQNFLGGQCHALPSRSIVPVVRFLATHLDRTAIGRTIILMPSQGNIAHLKRELLERNLLTAGVEFLTPSTFRHELTERFFLDCKPIAAHSLIALVRDACLSDEAIQGLLLLKEEDRHFLNFRQPVWDRLRATHRYSRPDLDFQILRSASIFADQFFSIGFEDSDFQMLNLLRIGDRIARTGYHLLLSDDLPSKTVQRHNFLSADTIEAAAKMVCGQIFTLALNSSGPIRIGLILPKSPSPLAPKIIDLLARCGIGTANSIREGQQLGDQWQLVHRWIGFQRTRKKREALLILQCLLENEMLSPTKFLQLRQDLEDFCERRLGDRCDDFAFPETFSPFFRGFPERDGPKSFHYRVQEIFETIDLAEELEDLEAANGDLSLDDFLLWLEDRLANRQRRRLVLDSPDAKVWFIDDDFKFLDDFDQLFLLDCSEKNFPARRFHPILTEEVRAALDRRTMMKLNADEKTTDFRADKLDVAIGPATEMRCKDPEPMEVKKAMDDNVVLYGAIDESERRFLDRIRAAPSLSMVLLRRTNPLASDDQPQISFHFLPAYLAAKARQDTDYLAIYESLTRVAEVESGGSRPANRRRQDFANSEFQAVHQLRRDPARPFGIYDFGIDRGENERLPEKPTACKAWENSFMNMENFWLTQILRLDFRRPRTIFENLKMLAGTKIHRQIETIVGQLTGREPAPDSDPGEPFPMEGPLWREAFRTTVQGKIADLRDQIETIFQEQWSAIKCEYPIAGEVAGEFPISVQGRVDLLLEGDGRFAILDFKTGTIDRLSTRRLRDGKFLQIALYGLLFRRSRPFGTIQILAPFCEPQSMPFTDFDRLDRFWSDFSRLQKTCNFGLRKRASVGNTNPFAFSHLPIDNAIIEGRLRITYPTFFLAERDMKAIL